MELNVPPPTYEEAMELNVPPPTYEEAMEVEPPTYFDTFGEAAPTNETTTIEIQGNFEIEDQIQIPWCDLISCVLLYLILLIIAYLVYYYLTIH